MALFNYECDEVKRKIDEASPNYPQLTTFEKEWLFFHKYHYIPGVPVELECETVNVNPNASVFNAIPFQYKSAILKGNTSYRDIDTGEILEAFEEGRNLELVSVKMPVLRTVGKNLLSSNMFNAKESNATTGAIASSNRHIITDYLKIDNNVDYTFSGITANCFNYVAYYDNNYNFIGRTGSGVQSTRTIKASEEMIGDASYRNDIMPKNCTYIIFAMNSNSSIGEVPQEELFEASKFVQLEKATSATPYEPYKSNILSTSEDVVLRGVGDVQDELNLLTGELTQRVGEIVLDGSESWRIKDDQIYIRNTDFPIQPPAHLPNGKLITDSDVQVNIGNNYMMFIRQDDLSENIKQDDNANTLSNWKAYLQQNPMTVQYQLATESIKTVDLPTLNKPYEGTNHYELTSDIPCEAILEVPVVSTGKQTLEEINN